MTLRTFKITVMAKGVRNESGLAVECLTQGTINIGFGIMSFCLDAVNHEAEICGKNHCALHTKKMFLVSWFLRASSADGFSPSADP